MIPFIRVFIMLFFFIFTFLFNLGLIDIRYEEINYLLGKAAFNRDASHALGIVTKYELIKRRIEFGEENSENYELEARVQALISGDQFLIDEAKQRTKNIYLFPVKLVLHGIRFTLGKEFINPKQENKIFKVLEIGYFWERNRKYRDAIDVYNEVLSMPKIELNLYAAVLMHKAFCLSMLSEYIKAKEVYENIINRYPDTEAGVLSWKLLGFLKSIEEKRTKVKKTSLSEFEKAKHYYLLMDYRNSIKYFSIFLQNNEKSKYLVDARYFKGRSHEELGESEEAVNEYRYTIKIDKKRKWAREANRRMLMIGEFYDYKKKVTDEAKKQLAAYKDDAFINKLGKYRNMISENTIQKELMKKELLMKSKNGNNKNLMELIDNIGNLDLVGENNLTKGRRKQKKASPQKLPNQDEHALAQLREQRRKKLLAANPYRKPNYLKGKIDGNINQLQYIYNKKLQSGIKLSGKMIIEMKIKPNGTVPNPIVLSTNMGDKDFERKILMRIKTWKFNSIPDSLGDLKIRYPFEFYEEF